MAISASRSGVDNWPELLGGVRFLGGVAGCTSRREELDWTTSL
jgi:hypothetical protein